MWTGEAAEETEAGGGWGRSTTAGELVHCGELFTVSHSVVTLLHALTTAALYSLPSTEELPHPPAFSGELIAVF